MLKTRESRKTGENKKSKYNRKFPNIYINQIITIIILKVNELNTI